MMTSRLTPEALPPDGRGPAAASKIDWRPLLAAHSATKSESGG
jgi:hypothetical protein